MKNQNLAFLFPKDPIYSKRCDEHYLDEYKGLQELGFDCFLIDPFDDSSRLYPADPDKYFDSFQFLYRGWMLKKQQYEQLYNKLNQKLKVSPENYINNHYIINWYDSLKDYTFETVFIGQDIEAEQYFAQNPGKRFLAKDYVKSLKTGNGSVLSSYEEYLRFKDEILKYKGFIEGDIVLREFKELKHTTETRFFVFNDELFYPKNIVGESYFEDFLEKATIIKNKHKETFYSLDLVLDNNNEVYLIEVGDGQVSDYTGWTINDFLDIFNHKSYENKLKIS